MKKTMRLTALLLALVMLFATASATLISCGSGNEGTDNQGTTPPEHEHEFYSSWLSNDTHHWHGAKCEHTDEVSGYATHTFSDGACTVCGKSAPGADLDIINYTVTLKTLGGMALENVTVFVVTESNLGVPVGYGTTDKEGVVRFTVQDTGDKHLVKLLSVPKGYAYDEYYQLGEDGVTITLEPSIIDGSEFKGDAYTLGGVMYDFTLKTVDGETIVLSELFENGKRGVLLNFWYSSCSPCRSEFPHMQAVYERYSDEISIIAINPTGESDLTITTFRNELGLTFDFVNGGTTLAQAFGVSAYPTSVFIDIYGTITFWIAGSLPSERPFEALFSLATADNYTQVIYETVEELLPKEENNLQMESSETVGGVLNSGEITVTYYPDTTSKDWKYSWPFATTTKDGKPCVKPMNAFKEESFATMHADVVLKAGDALIFDYYSSTESGADVLYVLVDGIDMVAISGDPKEWRTCCTFVAPEDKTYTVTFIYLKDDSDNVGDDTVYIADLRVGTVEDINAPTYIQREAATNPYANGDGFANYVTVVLGSDGYYHVGDENGPLLLADLMSYTNFSDENSIWGYAYDGEIVKNGKNYYEEIVDYCSYASNATIYGLCPVNEELAELLQIAAQIVGDGYYNENDWLEICKYYDAYGTDGAQLEDPIKGLATHSAFDTVLNTDSDPENYYPNTVTYDRLIMPRGLLYKFVPEKSGVYRITSNSKSEVDGWIFDENHRELLVYDHIERFLPAGITNVSMVIYMEAGEEYYIDIAFHEVTEVGSFAFKIEYESSTLDLFVAASPGFFTYELDESGELTNTLIAGGIDVALGEDGYYHYLLPDGSLGSIVYADFSMYTNLFPTGAIYNVADPEGPSLINQGAFDFSKTEADREAILSGYDKMSNEQLLALWGEELYQLNYDYYQIDDLRQGIYHGAGEDYTERMIEIANTKMLNSTNSDDANLYGCVAVDAELATILQALVDHASFKDVKNSWTKLCYYYQHYGPIA